MAPQIKLAIATAVTEVQVTLTPVEMAEKQVKEEEKQRVFGVIPNFYVSLRAGRGAAEFQAKIQARMEDDGGPGEFCIDGRDCGGGAGAK